MTTEGITPEVAMTVHAQRALDVFKAELAAIPDERDLKTAREQESAFIRRQQLQHRIVEVQVAVGEIKKIEPKTEELARWLDRLTRWRAEFADQLETARQLGGRDNQRRITGLEASLRNIDIGTEYGMPDGPQLIDSMRAVGYPVDSFPGSITAATEQLAKLQKRLETAHAVITAALNS